MGRFPAEGSLSPIGRKTDKELAKLRIECHVGDDNDAAQLQKRPGAQDGPHWRNRGHAPELDGSAVDLALASFERLRTKLELVTGGPPRPRPSSALVRDAKKSTAEVLRPSSASLCRLKNVDEDEDVDDALNQCIVLPSSAFSNTGMDTVPSSRFAVECFCPHRPNIDPGQYRIRWDAVIPSPPTPNLQKQTGRAPVRQKPEVQAGPPESEQSGTFITELDQTTSSVAAVQNAVPGQMSLSTKRPDLNVGGASERRPKIIMNQQQFPTEYDVLCNGDLKISPWLRNPEWNFHKDKGRAKSACIEGFSSEPGKYASGIEAATPVPKHSVNFKDTRPHSGVPANCWGFQTQPAALQPSQKRSPGGCVVDRSLAKDCVAARATHVSNFPKELPRPPMFKSIQSFHDESDASASALVLQQEMTFDADSAASAVLPRTDRSFCIEQAVPRGRQAMQGNRMFQSDRAMLGAHGYGFKETTRQQTRTVEQRECQAADGSRMKPGIAPDLGAGGRVPLVRAGESPARRKLAFTGFRRSASAGFVAAARTGCNASSAEKRPQSAGSVAALRTGWNSSSAEKRPREQTVLDSFSVDPDLET